MHITFKNFGQLVPQFQYQLQLLQTVTGFLAAVTSLEVSSEKVAAKHH